MCFRAMRVKIAEGNDVNVLRWGGEHALHGKVRRVEPAAFTKVSALGVEEQRVNVLIDLLEPPEQRPTLGDAFESRRRFATGNRRMCCESHRVPYFAMKAAGLCLWSSKA